MKARINNKLGTHIPSIIATLLGILLITSCGGGDSKTAPAALGFPTPVSSTPTPTPATSSTPIPTPLPAVAPAAINFIGAVPADKSIVIQGSGGNGQTEVALLTFMVVDGHNNPVANLGVTFATSQSVTLVDSTGTTDSAGKVTVALSSGTVPTTVRVTATVTNTTISAMSDSVRVTTAQPAQAGFSIAKKLNSVEGWDYDRTENTISVLLADQFGGSVADGTPVVFTTNSGSILGSGGAGCVTQDGGCSVTWRSQSPRLPSGTATVTATSTSGSTTLSTTISFYVVSSAVTLSDPTAFASLLFTSTDLGCRPHTTNITVTDVNGNPPADGTLMTASSEAATASFFPATADGKTTVFQLTVKPTGCVLTTTPPTYTEDTLTISATSPRGIVSMKQYDITVQK